MNTSISKLTAIFFMVLFTGQNLFAQVFFKTYDIPTYTSSTDIGYSIDRNFNGTVVGGWAIAGATKTTAASTDYDWLFMRLGSAGTLGCVTKLGFSQADSCFSYIQLENTTRRNILAGFYRATNGREKASFSMLDTSCGHVLSKQIDDSLRHEYRQVVKNPANDFTMAGYIQAYMAPNDYRQHILAAQYNSSGVLLWAFRYLPPYTWINERAFSICYQPFDGSYAITGITNRFTGPSGPYQVFIMKITSAGIPVWYKGYSPVTGAPSEGRRIIAMPDGGFVVAGWSPAYDPAANDYYIFRVSSAGAVIWSNTYGIPGYLEQSFSIIYQSGDASLVFTGFLKTAASTEDIILAKITASTGAPMWFKRFPNTPGDDRGFDLRDVPSEGGYSVTGIFSFSGNPALDVPFVKTNSFGNVTANCQDSTMLQQRQGYWSGDCSRQIMQLHDIQIQPMVSSPVPVIKDICGGVGIKSNTLNPEEFVLEQNYPNPFNPSTTIRYNIPVSGTVKLTVYNTAGEIVSTLVNKHQLSGTYEITFDASEISSGIYFYTLSADEFKDTKRMVIIK